MRKGAKHSPESLAKMREAALARDRASYLGHVVSNDTRAKISTSLRGRAPSDKARAAISAAFKGKPKSPEHRAKISAALRARNEDREPGYSTVHESAKKALPMKCASADRTCSGPLEVAFRHDTTPKHRRRLHPGKGWYSISSDDYIRLCRSHHHRFDG